VQNRILLSSRIQPDAADVEINIRRAIRRSARLDAEAIVVTASGSTVTLTGTVHTWDEHEAALDVAWAAPGVQAVDDRLSVTTEPVTGAATQADATVARS
jgi:osmotically-inducible protein OsmY